MNALVVQQFHWILAALAAGMLFALAGGLLLARGGPARDQAGDDRSDASARHQVLPHVMLLLVALAVAAGVLLLLPAALILRYIAGLPVLGLLLAAVALITAALVYAWRARPF